MLVGSVEDVADVAAAVLEDDVVDVEETLAWRSTNSFCRAELKLDPLLLVELTALVLPVLLVVLDAVSPIEDGS